MGPARYAERAPRWDATYPFRAERAERELRRLVVPTAVRLVGRRDPRRGHAVVGVHGRASVCFRRERGRRTRGGRCQSPSRVSSRSRVAPEPPRRKRSCTRSLAACLGFSAWGIQAVDAPAACATPRAWSTEVGPGPPRLRVRESGSGRRQNARGGCGADPRGAVRPSGHLEAQAIGKWRQRAARRRCSSADSASRNRRSCDSFRTHPLPAIDSPLSPRPKPRPAPLGTGAPLPPLSVVGECATGGGT